MPTSPEELLCPGKACPAAHHSRSPFLRPPGWHNRWLCSDSSRPGGLQAGWQRWSKRAWRPPELSLLYHTQAKLVASEDRPRRPSSRCPYARDWRAGWKLAPPLLVGHPLAQRGQPEPWDNGLPEGPGGLCVSSGLFKTCPTQKESLDRPFGSAGLEFSLLSSPCCALGLLLRLVIWHPGRTENWAEKSQSD